MLDAAAGDLLRVLAIETSRDYQPTGRLKGPEMKETPEQ